MSAPHVTGAVALLTQRHPDWSVRQMKSALMSTAGAAWGNSARTQEASVLLEGAGLVNVQAADSPLIFTEPGSLSFGDMNLLAGVTSKQLLLSRDGTRAAVPGRGRSSSSRSPRARAPRSSFPAVTVAPGGSVDVQVTARAGAAAPQGRQLRLRGAAPRRDDAPRPLRVLRHAPGPARGDRAPAPPRSRKAARGPARRSPTSTASPRRRSATRPTTGSGRTCRRTAGSACTRSAFATAS